MDAFTLVLWVLRIGFVVCLYLFLAVVVRTLWRDLRAAASTAVPSVGRLIVLASPLGRPEPGTSIPIDAVTSLGSDVNNTIVVDDPEVASQHALLTFRGRAWYLEDRGAGAPDARQRRGHRGTRRRSGSGTRSGWAESGCAWSDRMRRRPHEAGHASSAHAAAGA